MENEKWRIENREWKIENRKIESRKKSNDIKINNLKGLNIK